MDLKIINLGKMCLDWHQTFILCFTDASFPSLAAYAPSGTTSNMSPCFCPDFMYSTKPEISHSGIEFLPPVTIVPFSFDGCGPSSK